MAEALKSLIPLAKSETYKEILVAESAKVLTGKELLPPIEMKERTLTAKEMADILGITPNRVGIIANKFNFRIQIMVAGYMIKQNIVIKKFQTLDTMKKQ